MYYLFTHILLPATIVLIMFGMGLSLTKISFKILFIRPWVVLSGLLFQMLLLPLIAFIIAVFAPISYELKIGLMLISVCPGGTVSSLVTYWLKGNVALSISLTALNSLLILITLPLIVNFSISFFGGHLDAPMNLPVMDSVLNVLLLIILPTIIGIIIKEYKPQWALMIEKPLEKTMTFILLLVYVVIVFLEQKQGGNDWSTYLKVFIITLILNFVSMAISYFSSIKLGFKNKNSYTIAIEVGLQNTALAIFVATTLLKSPNIAIVPVVYGSFSFFSTFLFAYWASKRKNLNKAI